MYQIRELALSWKYQNLFKISEKGIGQIFENKTNFSRIQLMFVEYLNLYSKLYENLYNGQDEGFLTEEVIKNEERCDAYLYWKQTKFEEAKQTQQIAASLGQHDKSIIEKDLDYGNAFSFEFKKTK
jgi:hypothetical protein